MTLSRSPAPAKRKANPYQCNPDLFANLGKTSESWPLASAPARFFGGEDQSRPGRALRLLLPADRHRLTRARCMMMEPTGEDRIVGIAVVVRDPPMAENPEQPNQIPRRPRSDRSFGLRPTGSSFPSGTSPGRCLKPRRRLAGCCCREQKRRYHSLAHVHLPVGRTQVPRKPQHSVRLLFHQAIACPAKANARTVDRSGRPA